MPLNYDLTKINNFEELLNESNQLKQPYNTIVFATMIVGMGEITEKNYNKFYNRLNVVERINGAFLRDSVTRNETYIQEEDIKRMIGLKTNVGKDFTKATFMSNIKRMLPKEL